MFVIDFDELHLGELLEIFHQRARDVVERAIRLAVARQVNMCNAIGKGEFAVTGETVENQGEALVTFDVAGSLEEFVHGRA
jgi:hypothetical protein